MDIRDITIGASYRGDPNLGGSTFGVATIDTKPLLDLAAYTYAYKSKMWEQEQKDLEAKSKEMADFTSYDLTNSISKYSKQVRDEYDSLYSWVRENPDVLDYKNNQKGYLEYKKRRNSLENNLKDGKSQEIIYKAAQAKIEAETRPEVKAFLQKQLDGQIAANDIRTPIKIQQYGAEQVELPAVPMKKFDVIRKDANGDMITDREFEVPDQKFINGQAAAIGLGLKKEVLDVNSPAFKQLSPEIQKFKIEENEKAKGTGRLAEVDQAEVITEALQTFRDKATGKIDIQKVTGSNAIIAGSIAAIDAYNQQMREEKAKINSGYYSDNLGVLKFGVNGLDERDYAEIDYSDGDVSAVDLLKVKIRAKAPVATYKTDAEELSNANDLQKERMQQAGQNYRARLQEAGQNARSKTAAGIGKDVPVLEKPAMLFGQHIQRLKDTFAKNPNDLTVQYRKVDDKTRIAANMVDGDEIVYKVNGTFDIKDAATGKVKSTGTIDNLAQGFIESVKKTDAALGDDKDGTMAEGFQIKSESKFKELFGTTSGQAIWDNWGVDVSGAATSLAEGGSTSVSGSQKQSYNVKGKTYTKGDLNKLGYTDAQIEEAIKLGNIK